MKTLHKLIIALLITFAASAEMPSYQWVDIDLIWEDQLQGRIRCLYQSSGPDNETHTYSVTAASLTDGDLSPQTMQLVASDAGNGTYNFATTFIFNAVTYASDIDNQNVPNPLPGSLKENAFDFAQTQIVDWGPVRVDQNADGLAEDREWIDVRVSWTGGSVGLAGTVTARLDRAGLRQYNADGNNEPNLLNAYTDLGNVTHHLHIQISYTEDGQIMQEIFGSPTAFDVAQKWGKPAGNGDYTGPLDPTIPGQNTVGVYEVVILGLGPTVGGPGDDGIDNGGGDGGGDGDDNDPDDQPPDPEDDPPLPGEGPTGLDCIDSKLAKAEEEYNVEFLTTIAEGAQKVYIKSWYFNTAQYLPGGSIEVIIRSDGQYEQLAGAAEGINLAKSFSRIFSAIWFTLLAFNAFVAVTLSW